MNKTLLLLLVLYQVKHFLADYPLQRPYMLNKFKGGTAWILPLCAHAGVHGGFTLAITLAVAPALWWLALADFAVHFTVDRAKAAPTWGGRWKPNEPYFWWALGADQMVHHLTHYAIIFALLAR
jgi:hypothetical protein